MLLAAKPERRLVQMKSKRCRTPFWSQSAVSSLSPNGLKR
jgi:hypothetical protein